MVAVTAILEVSPPTAGLKLSISWMTSVGVISSGGAARFASKAFCWGCFVKELA